MNLEICEQLDKARLIARQQEITLTEALLAILIVKTDETRQPISLMRKY